MKTVHLRPQGRSSRVYFRAPIDLQSSFLWASSVVILSLCRAEQYTCSDVFSRLKLEAGERVCLFCPHSLLPNLNIELNRRPWLRLPLFKYSSYRNSKFELTSKTKPGYRVWCWASNGPLCQRYHFSMVSSLDSDVHEFDICSHNIQLEGTGTRSPSPPPHCFTKPQSLYKLLIWPKPTTTKPNTCFKKTD